MLTSSLKSSQIKTQKKAKVKVWPKVKRGSFLYK